jgi:hypothetical protein
VANNRPDPNSPPSTPRWVKILITVFIILVVLFVIAHLLGLGMGGHTIDSHSILIEYALRQL